VEGWVGAFGADADLHRILGVRGAHGERDCRRREGECHSSGDSHDVLTLVLATAMGPLVTSRAVSENPRPWPDNSQLYRPRQPEIRGSVSAALGRTPAELLGEVGDCRDIVDVEHR